jgi:hypothetical protein
MKQDMPAEFASPVDRRYSPLPLAGGAGVRSAPGEGGAWTGDIALGCATLVRLRHLLTAAGAERCLLRFADTQPAQCESKGIAC